MSDAIPPLFVNQLKTVKLHARSKIVFDTSDPGTGKTRSATEAHVQFQPGTKMLVLCTVSTMVSVWVLDLKTFYPHLRVTTLFAKDRLEHWREEADVYVCNHDGVKWLAERLVEVRERFAGGTLVIDESSYFKHRGSARSRAAVKVRKCFDRVTLMTGLPDSNTILDMWHQAFLLDGGRRLGDSYYKFRHDTCKPVPVGRDGRIVTWVDKPGAELAVAQLLRDITIRHKFEDCHDIPKNTPRMIKWQMPARLMKQYEALRKQALLVFEAGKIVNAVHAGVLAQKLLQLASGAVYTTDEDYQLIDSSRYELTADLVAERKHSLVFFYWWHQRVEMEKEFKKRSIKYAIIDGTISQAARPEIVARFQAGEYQALLLHPKTAAHGLTLTRATATIWPSPTHDQEWWVQGNRRMLRYGQKEETETIRIEAIGTREDNVYTNLDNKRVRSQNLLNLLV